MANEQRLIDADALMDSIKGYRLGKIPKGELEWKIENAPTVDAVHAAGGCYCRECRYLQQDTHGLWCFRDYENPLKLDGFCSYGERREKDAVD